MIHHYNRWAFIILVLFTVPFYHFLFSRYLDLKERHFSSDILVPLPDSSDLYSQAIGTLSIYFPSDNKANKKQSLICTTTELFPFNQNTRLTRLN